MFLTLSIILNILLIIVVIYLNSQKILVRGPLNFDGDMQFLLYLIAHKFAQIKKFYLQPSQAAKSSFIPDEDARKYQEKIIVEVIDSLSTSYKLTMSKYFKQSGLEQFIIEIVTREFTDKCVNMNLSENFIDMNAETQKKNIVENAKKDLGFINPDDIR